MPIDTTDGTATVADATTEQTTTIGKITDGMTAVWDKDKGLTHDEAFYAAIGYALVGWIVARRSSVRLPLLG
jgi:hypothetical protein